MIPWTIRAATGLMVGGLLYWGFGGGFLRVFLALGWAAAVVYVGLGLAAYWEADKKGRER